MGCGWRVLAGGVCFVWVLADLGKILANLGQNHRQDGSNWHWRSPSPGVSFPTYDGRLWFPRRVCPSDQTGFAIFTRWVCHIYQMGLPYIRDRRAIFTRRVCYMWFEWFHGEVLPTSTLVHDATKTYRSPRRNNVLLQCLEAAVPTHHPIIVEGVAALFKICLCPGARITGAAVAAPSSSPAMTKMTVLEHPSAATPPRLHNCFQPVAKKEKTNCT